MRHENAIYLVLNKLALRRSHSRASRDAAAKSGRDKSTGSRSATDSCRVSPLSASGSYRDNLSANIGVCSSLIVLKRRKSSRNFSHFCLSQETHNLVKFTSGAKTSASKSLRLLLFSRRFVRELRREPREGKTELKIHVY